jgi:hypothetical protein
MPHGACARACCEKKFAHKSNLPQCSQSCRKTQTKGSSGRGITVGDKLGIPHDEKTARLHIVGTCAPPGLISPAHCQRNWARLEICRIRIEFLVGLQTSATVYAGWAAPRNAGPKSELSDDGSAILALARIQGGNASITQAPEAVSPPPSTAVVFQFPNSKP